LGRANEYTKKCSHKNKLIYKNQDSFSSV
jgi:hypothetical protein